MLLLILLPALTTAPALLPFVPAPPCRRIILENSGVAEPQNIRDQFNEAVAQGHPLTQRIYLDTLVTGGRWRAWWVCRLLGAAGRACWVLCVRAGRACRVCLLGAAGRCLSGVMG